MKRRYETTIEIKPVIGNVGFESGTDSGDDIDSIQSEFYESALDQLERNFCDFNPTKINITVRDPQNQSFLGPGRSRIHHENFRTELSVDPWSQNQLRFRACFSKRSRSFIG